MLRDVYLRVGGRFPANLYDVHMLIYERMQARTQQRRFLFCPKPEFGAILLRSAALPNDLRRTAVPTQRPRAGEEVRFTLTASPSRRQGETRDRYWFPASDVSSRVAWLEKRACSFGFALTARPAVEATIIEIERQGRRFGIDRTCFHGTLRVVDQSVLHGVLEAGIGPHKAFGMGLLEVLIGDSGS